MKKCVYAICAYLLFGLVHCLSAPSPKALLKGVESVRLQIPPSSLLIDYKYVDNLVTNESQISADFDNGKYMLAYIPPSEDESICKSLFDGDDYYVYNEAIRQVEIRTPLLQNQIFLFDPRLIGISTYFNWEETIQLLLWQDQNVELTGSDKFGTNVGWHVKIKVERPVGKWDIDFWVDADNSFRVYRVLNNGVTTESFYENEQYPWLPSKVVQTRRTRSGHVATTQWELVKAETAKFPKSKWSMAGLGLPQGIDVVDVRVQKRIGRWDGKNMIAELENTPEKRSGLLLYVCFGLLLIVPLVYHLNTKRKRAV